MQPNRVVALLTPPLAGLIVKVIPDPAVAFTVAGALILAALTWLRGWQQFEHYEQDLELILAGQENPPGGAHAPRPGVSPPMGQPLLPDPALLTPAAQVALQVKPSGEE